MKTRIKIKPDYYSGNRKPWYKLVTGIDDTKTNGYSFIGDFITANKEIDLEVGAIIIECRPSGSVKNWGKKGVIYRVIDGDIDQISEEFDYMKDFLSFRDAVAEAIGFANDHDALKVERDALMARIAEIDEILNR